MGRVAPSTRRLLAAGAMSLAALMAACAGLPQVPATTTAPAVPSGGTPTPVAPEPSATAAAPAGNVYTNTDVGFSIRLPEGWTVAGPFVVEADGLTYDLYLLGVDPLPNSGPGMSQIVVGETPGFSLDAFAAQQCKTCPPHPIESASLGGRPAQRLLIGGGGVPFNVEWTFVELGARLVGFSPRDPDTLEPLVDVLDSVTFP